MKINKKKYLPIFFAVTLAAVILGIILGTIYGQAVLAATATKKPAVTDPTKSVVGKDPCYSYIKSTTITKNIYAQRSGNKPLFSFYGNDANISARPYGKGGTIVAAGNVAAQGGTVNFGTINNGTMAKISAGGDLDFYVKNNKILTFSGGGITTNKGMEIKGNLSADKVYIRGKEVKAANINGQNILYTEL